MNAYAFRVLTDREDVWIVQGRTRKGARRAVIQALGGGRILATTRAASAPRRLGP